MTFTIVDDNVYEGDEIATLTISNPSSGIALGTTLSQDITITDNDTKPTFDIGTAATSVDEGVGTVTITVNRSGAPGNAVTVDLK